MKSIPKYVKDSLNCASGSFGGKLFVNNKKANEWLTDNLSLYTDDNEHELEGHIVDFCWKVQKWFVK